MQTIGNAQEQKDQIILWQILWTETKMILYQNDGERKDQLLAQRTKESFKHGGQNIQ